VPVVRRHQVCWQRVGGINAQPLNPASNCTHAAYAQTPEAFHTRFTVTSLCVACHVCGCTENGLTVVGTVRFLSLGCFWFALFADEAVVPGRRDVCRMRQRVASYLLGRPRSVICRTGSAASVHHPQKHSHSAQRTRMHRSGLRTAQDHPMRWTRRLPSKYRRGLRTCFRALWSTPESLRHGEIEPLNALRS